MTLRHRPPVLTLNLTPALFFDDRCIGGMYPGGGTADQVPFARYVMFVRVQARSPPTDSEDFSVFDFLLHSPRRVENPLRLATIRDFTKIDCILGREYGTGRCRRPSGER